MATEMSLRIGNRIRQRREELGIKTQRELADLIPISSVTNQTINKWEKGAHEPGPQYKALLAKALQVDVAYFIADEPQGPTPDLSRLPADQGLADRLDRIEQRIQRLIEEQDERLRRQDEVLARIEAAVATDTRIRDEISALINTSRPGIVRGDPPADAPDPTLDPPLTADAATSPAVPRRTE